MLAATTLPFSHDAPSLEEVVIRLALAMALGGVIGFERESHGRAAGLRTTMLACLAACIAAILSEFLFTESATGAPLGSWRPDPARLAQGVLAGMGFLGAGVVVREGKIVRGVTTAAVLWFVTILGLTIGSGHYALATVGWGFSMIALVLLPYVERFVAADLYGSVSVTVQNGGVTDDEIRAAVETTGASVKELAFDYDLPTSTRTLRMAVKYKRGDLVQLAQNVRTRLSDLKCVSRIQWGTS